MRDTGRATGSDQPQTRRATSTTRSSFRRCSTGVSGFPGAVLANPHWGLSASRSSGTNRGALTASSVGTLHRPPPSDRATAPRLSLAAELPDGAISVGPREELVRREKLR